MSLDQEFLKASTDKLDQLLRRIESCVDRLTPEQIWTRGSENENAIGNLMLHLAGNVRQWILHGVAGRPDNRIRDLEFATRTAIATEELKHRLRSAVEEALQVIAALTPEQLLEKTTVQVYDDVSKLQAVFHVVEHFSMHTGQIIYLTKAQTGEDLGFYKHLSTQTRGEAVP